MVTAVVLDTDSDTEPVCVEGAGPVLVHTPVPSPQYAGEDVTIDLEAHDYDGVHEVEVRYRPSSTEGWRTEKALYVGGSDYQAVIDGHHLESETMYYYLWAIDECGDASCEPSGCDANPWSFTVVL